MVFEMPHVILNKEFQCHGLVFSYEDVIAEDRIGDGTDQVEQMKVVVPPKLYKSIP